MFTEDHSDGSVSCTACIRVSDFVRAAQQLQKDDMKYVQIRVIFNGYDEDRSDIVRLSAVTGPDCEDITVYPDIEGFVTMELDDEEY